MFFGIGSGVRRASGVVVQSQKKQMMMWEALREATDEEMEKDPTVCVMGKDGRAEQELHMFWREFHNTIRSSA